MLFSHSLRTKENSITDFVTSSFFQSVLFQNGSLSAWRYNGNLWIASEHCSLDWTAWCSIKTIFAMKSDTPKVRRRCWLSSGSWSVVSVNGQWALLVSHRWRNEHSRSDCLTCATCHLTATDRASGRRRSVVVTSSSSSYVFAIDRRQLRRRRCPFARHYVTWSPPGPRARVGFRREIITRSNRRH